MSSLDIVPFLLLFFLCFPCYPQVAPSSSLLGFIAFAFDQGNRLSPALAVDGRGFSPAAAAMGERSALRALCIPLPCGAMSSCPVEPSTSRAQRSSPSPQKCTLSVLIKEVPHPSLSLLVFLSPEIATFSWATRAVGLVIFSTGRCADSCSAVPRCPCLIPGHVPAVGFEMDFRLVSHQASAVSGRGWKWRGPLGKGREGHLEACWWRAGGPLSPASRPVPSSVFTGHRTSAGSFGRGREGTAGPGK